MDCQTSHGIGRSGKLQLNYRYFADFNFGYNGSENFADGHRFGFFPAFSSRLEYSRRNVYKETSEMDEYVQVTLFYGKVGSDKLKIGDTTYRFPYLYTIKDDGKWLDLE